MPPRAAHPEEGDPDDTFIDLYVADVAVPTIGRSLLGDDGYNRLAGRLKPGQQALIVAGSGRYSFKGAAYVRGGIFDRIELIQDTNSIRFRDRDHTRLGSLAAEGAPEFPEIALFAVPPEFALDPTEPWMLQLLGAARGRHTGKGLAHLRSRLQRFRISISSASRRRPSGSRRPRLPQRPRPQQVPKNPPRHFSPAAKTSRCG